MPQIAWAILVVTILIVVAARVRLSGMPLERDEGEYAYAGQLLSEGVPPYKLAYNMKLPGTYAMYALMMAIFGQTPTGIHIGLLVVNVATIVMVYLLGRRLLDPITGAAAALVYGLLSMSPALLGLAAHATHFVTFFAMIGILLLLEAAEKKRGRLYFLTGCSFGLAFLMKQPGIAFGIFGVGYAAWQGLKAGEPRGRVVMRTGLVIAGIVVPYLLTCGYLGYKGVLKDFWYWTVGYANQYVSTVPWSVLRESIVASGKYTIVPTLAFWLFGAMGIVMMWFERRLDFRQYFILGLIATGMVATGAGLYFRAHYYITLLPALAIVCGVAVSRSVDQLLREKSVELFSALGVLAFFAIAVLVAFVEDGNDWFGRSPQNVVRMTYGSTLFNDSVSVAKFIDAQFPKNAKVAVIGSEPQIYFYSKRKSATGHIYTYGLMGKHRFAREMQDVMIKEIEKAKPECIVYVEDSYSWLKTPGTDEHIFEWWKNYWEMNYELLQTFNIDTRNPTAPTDDENREPTATRYFMVLKRKAGTS